MAFRFHQYMGIIGAVFNIGKTGGQAVQSAQ
jgi:hypothetical protein